MPSQSPSFRNTQNRTGLDGIGDDDDNNCQAMSRPSSTPTRGILWRDLVEDGWTTDEIAEMAGVSVRTVQRRIAQARESSESDDDRPEVGDKDADYLELVDRSPEHPIRGYYDLATDATSHDGTSAFVFIGTGRGGTPRRNRLGTGKHVDTGQSYRSKDDGLKGGKG